jgi:ubiquinone/menaquinone biosynthesis C-methylase UbiE
MNRVEYVKPDFPPDAFAGTASYYLRYRVPYPQALMSDLIKRARVTGRGRLLDLACGPGRIALALVSSFREVWAVDLEPEMIAVGQQAAAQRSVNTITWIVGRAEALQAAPASFELITIGEAFHRLDQELVAKQTLQWLQPGCCVATLGGYGLMQGNEPWQGLVADIVRQWTSRTRPSGGAAQPQPGSDPAHYEQVLRDTGFEAVGSETFIQENTWTVNTIIGYLYSTSFCSKNVLGDNAAAFEANLRAALLSHDPNGTYREHMHFGYTIGRRPV